jgi:hypothetical protein
MITWTLSGHIIFALATGIACGIVAGRYPEVISPPYAASSARLSSTPVWLRCGGVCIDQGGTADDE